MQQLPNSRPSEFCVAFIERELKSFKEASIYMTSWDTMERMIERSSELERVFQELIERYGYADKLDMTAPEAERQAVWLILEHIWSSTSYVGEKVAIARLDKAELNRLNTKIVTLAEDLASAISQQEELYRESGFSCGQFQTARDMLDGASNDNGHYSIGPKDEIDSLSAQYDLKYWPSREDLISEVAMFQGLVPTPTHYLFSESTLNGKKSAAKDFVITFDEVIEEMICSQISGLSEGCKFSNNAMADIYNVSLNKEPSEYIDGDAIRKVRYRHALKNTPLSRNKI